MGKPTTGEELLAVLETSQLVHKNLLDSLRSQLKALGPDAQDPQKTALILVKNHVCTAYQARQLLEGRFKGFYIGKYKFLELLGAGGMGKVYLAEQITMQRLVAIKVVRQNIPKNMQKEVLARFTREARAVAGLQHHNIIRAYDFDQENGVPYFVMEYVEGIDAANQVIKFGPTPYHQAADYMMQAADALHHAHKNGMVHRDIKPGNLLVSTSGEIKVLDLGLVACFDGTQNHSLTVAENQLGTIDYIAPEQAIDSHKVDPRADIYSLGATFYTIISGKVLFPGKTTAQKLLLNQMEPPTPIQQHVPQLPDELASIIHKMLAKKPEDRIQTCEEVMQVLAPFASRIVPPYDPSAVKYRISELDEYLGRSPEASQINFNLINQDTPTQSAKINSPSDAKKTGGVSSSVVRDSIAPASQAEDEFLKAINEMAELNLPSVPRKRAAGSKAIASPSSIGSRSGLSSRSRLKKKPVPKKKGAESQNAVTLVAAISTLVVAVMFILFYSLSSFFKPSSRVVSAPIASQEKLQKKVDDTKSSGASNQPASNSSGDGKAASTTAANNPGGGNKPDSGNKPKANTSPNKPKPSETSSVVANSKPDEKATNPKPADAKPLDAKPDSNVAMTPKSADDKKADEKVKAPIQFKTPQDRWLAYVEQMHNDESLVWHSTFVKGKDKNAALENQAKKSPIAKAKLETRLVQPAPGRFEDKDALLYLNKVPGEYAGITHEALHQINFSNGLTLSMWFRSDPENNESFALVNRGNKYWRIHRIKGKNVLQFATGIPGTSKSLDIETISEFNLGEWHHVVATIRPVGNDQEVVLTLYLNGEKESAKKGTLVPSDVPTGLKLGEAQETSSRLGFRGLIDEFAIHNRPLSDDEVRQMFQAGNLEPTQSGVVTSTK